jgi:hypothetical protein
MVRVLLAISPRWKIITHILEQGSYVCMEFSSIHLLLRLLFSLFLLVIFIFRAFVSPVSGVPIFEAPSFLHQLVLPVNCQSVNIHSVQVPFPV